jgi:hypothetical protein
MHDVGNFSRTTAGAAVVLEKLAQLPKAQALLKYKRKQPWF